MNNCQSHTGRCARVPRCQYVCAARILPEPLQPQRAQMAGVYVRHETIEFWDLVVAQMEPKREAPAP